MAHIRPIQAMIVLGLIATHAQAQQPTPPATYKDLAAINQRLAEVAAANPRFCRVFDIIDPATNQPFQTIPTTANDGGVLTPQPIKAIAITKGVGRRPDANRPSILLTGGIHAREWVAPDFCLRMVDFLLADPEAAAPLFNVFDAANQWSIKKLLENVEIVIVPVVNPDGYAFSRIPGNTVVTPWSGFDAAGNPTLFAPIQTPRRLWRKSRRDFTTQVKVVVGGNVLVHAGNARSFGVDLNRNFPPKWDPPSETEMRVPMSVQSFRGDTEGSEVETKAIMALNALYDFDGMLFYHSHFGSYLYPLGFTAKSIDEELGADTKTIRTRVGDQRQITDLNLYRDLATRLVDKGGLADKYGIVTAGKFGRTPSSGHAGDWAYLNEKSIYYTVELNRTGGIAPGGDTELMAINKFQPPNPGAVFDDQRVPALYFCFVVADNGFKSKPRWVER